MATICCGWEYCINDAVNAFDNASIALNLTPIYRIQTMRLKKLMIQAVLASVLVIGFGLTAMTSGQASSYGQPPLTAPAVAFAKDTTDILQKRLFAALSQEFSETTPATAKNGSAAISLIFNDNNHNMRLVGTVGPLRKTDRPEDGFERTVVSAAVNNQNAAVTEGVYGEPGEWYYRRAIPISNAMSTSCVLCHSNYGALPTNKQIVGVLALKVPIKSAY
jgi:hypothetical protein